MSDFGTSRRSPRSRLLTERGLRTLVGALAFAIVACISCIVVLYPDGIARWDHGHLSISLDR